MTNLKSDTYFVLCSNCGEEQTDQNGKTLIFEYDEWRESISDCQNCKAKEGDFGIGSILIEN